eukprot:2869417-Prymnesium_polylepis.1
MYSTPRGPMYTTVSFALGWLVRLVLRKGLPTHSSGVELLHPASSRVVELADKEPTVHCGALVAARQPVRCAGHGRVPSARAGGEEKQEVVGREHLVCISAKKARSSFCQYSTSGTPMADGRCCRQRRYR